MVGGNLPGETRTLSVAIYDRMQAFDDRSAGVMAATLLVIAVATLMATTALSRGWSSSWLTGAVGHSRQPGPIPLDVEFACEPGDVLAIFGPPAAARRRSCAPSRDCTAGAAISRSGAEMWTDTARRRSRRRLSAR